MSEDFLTLRVVGDRAVTRNMDQLPEQVHELLRANLRPLLDDLKDLVQDNIRARLQGSGNLESQVEVEIVEDGLMIDGQVYIAGVPYARAQEEGASIGPHMIFAKNSKVLAFMAASGDKVFATKVFHPGGQIPGSFFMKDALREMGPRISKAIKNSVVQGIRQKMRSGS